MEKIKEMSIEELIPDDKNFNKGTEYGGHLLEKSFEKFGAGRSILLDKNNRIIAGNKATEKYGATGGEKVIVVETDGNTLVAVKRTDVDLDSKKGRELALADNATQKADLEWDDDMLKDVSKDWDFDTDSWGVQLWDDEENEQLQETAKLSTLQFDPLYYQPQKKPDVNLADCVDLDKYESKLKIIEESDLSDDEKSIMKYFAYRFIKIDFENVANYYSFNASDSEKRILERLRLVLIDKGNVDGFIEDELLKIAEITNIEEE